MILFILFLCALLIGAIFLGYKRMLRLDQLNYNRVLNGVLIILGILTLMSIAHWLGLFSQTVAAKITMSAYTLAGGFFLGYGIKLIQMRSKAGTIEYIYRSFWTDIAPNLIFVALFVFGIYRTGLFQWGHFTGIGITSGLSLIGFGFMGWTFRIVPEFRDQGILMLDQYIEWQEVVSYQWIDEDTLQVDYFTDATTISEFKTYIPSEDQLIIERVLSRKLQEHKEDRKDLMLKNKEQ